MQSAYARYENVGESEVVSIRVNLITPCRTPLRSELGDLGGLEKSISRNGLLSPILVRRTASSRFEVVAGNRRLQAFKNLGRPQIPSRVIEADDRESFEVSLVENVQRQTLDPLDEARAFYNYVCSKERHGLGYGSVVELAEHIGKSQEYVSNRIGLLRLPESTVRRLLDGKLTVSHLEELAALSGNQPAVDELAALISTHRISVRVLESAVRLIKGGMTTERALSLARIESDLRLTSVPEADEEEMSKLMKRTKRVLEATLSYLDNAMPTLEKDPDLYRYWAENVRRPVHKAIDGTIVCQKKLARNCE